MTTQETKLEAGEIVQLNPRECSNPMFAGCLMVVEEVHAWGVQGYVPAIGEEGCGLCYYYRATWNEMERTGGKAAFFGKIVDG